MTVRKGLEKPETFTRPKEFGSQKVPGNRFRREVVEPPRLSGTEVVKVKPFFIVFSLNYSLAFLSFVKHEVSSKEVCLQVMTSPVLLAVPQSEYRTSLQCSGRLQKYVFR